MWRRNFTFKGGLEHFKDMLSLASQYIVLLQMRPSGRKNQLRQCQFGDAIFFQGFAASTKSIMHR